MLKHKNKKTTKKYLPVFLLIAVVVVILAWDEYGGARARADFGQEFIGPFDSPPIDEELHFDPSDPTFIDPWSDGNWVPVNDGINDGWFVPGPIDEVDENEDLWPDPSDLLDDHPAFPTRLPTRLPTSPRFDPNPIHTPGFDPDIIPWWEYWWEYFNLNR